MLSFGLSFVRFLIITLRFIQNGYLNGTKTFWSSLKDETNGNNKFHVFPTLYIRGHKSTKNLMHFSSYEFNCTAFQSFPIHVHSY